MFRGFVGLFAMLFAIAAALPANAAVSTAEGNKYGCYGLCQKKCRQGASTDSVIRACFKKWGKINKTCGPKKALQVEKA